MTKIRTPISLATLAVVAAMGLAACGGGGSGGNSNDDNNPASDSGKDDGCIETTYEITNWPGTSYNNSLYTGTSWELEGCTEIQSSNLKITIRCEQGATGNAELISEGCAVIGIAAPGNILSTTGAEPSGGRTACGGKTVKDSSTTCYQECRKELRFRITSGSCS